MSGHPAAGLTVSFTPWYFKPMIIMAFLLAAGLSLQPRPAPRPHARPVLVLLVAGNEADKKREKRFVTELRMVLDEIPVRTVRPEVANFASQSLAAQIVLIRKLAGRRKAAGVTWIARPTADLLMLHMVVISTGRALVRLVETRVKKGSEEQLALAARELLGTAYLFDRRTRGRKTPIGRVVEQVRAKIAPPAPRLRRRQPDRPWGFLGGLTMRGGIAGSQGPSYWMGGTIEAERRIVSGLLVRLGFGATGGPLEPLKDGSVNGWEISPHLGTAYLWKLGRVRLGPSLELKVNWTRLEIQVGSGPRQKFTFYGFRAFVGPELE
jgi:hypothetical protein